MNLNYQNHAKEAWLANHPRQESTMDIRALRYFVELVREQSFTRASEKSCSSPSPPSAK